MNNILKEINDIIEKNKHSHDVTIKIIKWVECGEFSGDDTRPIMKIKIKKNKKNES